MIGFLNLIYFFKAGRWTFLLLGMWYGSSKLQALKVKDEPIRKAKIEQATKDHERAVREKTIADKGMEIEHKIFVD